MVNMKSEIKKRIQVKNNIISCPIQMSDLPGLGSALFQKMKENGDAIAQIDGITGKNDTYKHYLERCVRTAMTMRKRGVTSKDIISICSFNNLNTTVPYIAALFLGTKPACLDPTLTQAVTSHILKQVRPKMIFTGPESIKLIEDAVKEAEIETQIIVFGDTMQHIQFSEFLLPFADENDFKPVEISNTKDTAIILFSSGTTGFPKGICLSHYGLLGRGMGSGILADMSVSLSFASIYWISSTLILLVTVFAGYARVVFPKFDANAVWHLIEKFKVTTLFAVPTQIISMCINGRPKGVNASSLQYAFIGGSAISKQKLMEVRGVLKETLVSNNYGLTELSGLALTLNYLEDPLDMTLFLAKPHTLGRPMDGFSYKVVNPETEEVLGPNQAGELRVKTEFQMNGYYNMDSASTWDSDGFLKTGDVVYYDRDYSFYYIDRIKEMLQYRTHTLVPTKLEAILLTHPAVECAVVFGLPHPEDGDHPTGVVVLTKAAIGKIKAEDIEKYVEDRVTEVEKLRGGVRIAKTIFITPSGKLSRRRMKDLVMRGEI